MERYEAEQAGATQSTRHAELMFEESNRIWDTIIDPPSRNRWYSYENHEALMSQWPYRRSQGEEEIAQMKKQLVEINDWRKSALALQLDEHIAAFLDNMGRCLEKTGRVTKMSRYACVSVGFSSSSFVVM